MEKLLVSGRLAQKFVKTLCVSLLLLYGGLIVTHPVWRAFGTLEARRQEYEFLLTLAKTLPADKSLSVSNSVGPHFAQREKLFLFDPPWLNKGLAADFIILDFKEYFGARDELLERDYTLFQEQGQIKVYSRNFATVNYSK